MAFSLAGVAFNSTNFAGQPNELSYTTVDDATAVETAGYFNDLTNRVAIGDMIRAELDTDGTRACKLYRVTNNTSGVVTITEFTPDAPAAAGGE